MQYVITLLLGFTLAGNVTPQTEQTELLRYHYSITGKVVFSKSQPQTGITVYIMPATRPINGRIPFTHTDENGRFSIEFMDVPDKYKVCAHPGETEGLIPLAPAQEKAEKIPVMFTCSKSFRLPAEDTERSVWIRLK